MLLRYREPPDFGIILTVLILLCIGIIMVFSSSSVRAFYEYKDSFYFLKRQMIWAFLGFIAMIFFMNYDYWNIKKHEKTIVFMMFFLLIIVLIPGIGIKRNEARRWLGFGALTIQPSELAKIGMIIYISTTLEKRQEYINSFTKGLMPFLIVIGIVCGLIVIEPHLSASVLIGLNAIIMLFIGGCNVLHLLSIGAIGFAGVIVLIFTEGYRMSRYISFLNPWEYTQSKGYQIIQSLYALGSGGLLGVGLGQSRQKYFWLPEPQTDFIFAIIGEELGFIGASLVIILFAFLIWRGYRIALLAPDLFGKFLAAGITTLITLQFLINIAVVTASMPVTGMPLPFISYGGSSLVLTMSQVGILLNISKYLEAK